MNGHTKTLYLLLSAIAALVLVMAGAFLGDMIAQRNRMMDRLDSLDQRVARIEHVDSRLSSIEADIRAIRENIRKLY